MAVSSALSGGKRTLGRTPLHLAAEYNKLDELEELLKSKQYDVNAQDTRGFSALHCLLDRNIMDNLDDITRGIQMLLDFGSDVNLKDHFGDTPLHLAFYSYVRSTPYIIRFLLENSSIPFDHGIKNCVGYTVFYKLVVGHSDDLQEEEDFDEIVEETERIINEFLDGKFTSLSKMTELLNEKDIHGCSAFHTYTNVVEYRLETIKRMIARGADVNTKSDIGITPLMDAIYVQTTPIVRILLEAKADPNIRDIFGQSAIFRVFTIEDFELLCQHGVVLGIKDKFGRSPLNDTFLYTSEKSPKSGVVLSDIAFAHRPLAEYFIERGLDPNERDNHGSTPLHYAAWHGHPWMTSILLERGADPGSVDNNGLTPYDIAQRYENFNICSLLRPNDESHTEITDEIVKYNSLHVNFKDIDKMDHILENVVEFRDDPSELVQYAISSSRIGLVTRKPESLQLKSDIVDFMKIIAETVSFHHPIFRCRICHVGSSADDTKIGDPDEFDFMFCLDYFAEECIPHQSEEFLGSGFAMLKMRPFTEGHPLGPFTSDDNLIESYIVRDTFQEHVTEAINSPEVWERVPRIYFDGLLKFNTDKPNITLEVDWFGPAMKNVRVSIDMVPAVVAPDWIPMELKSILDKEPNTRVEKGSYMLLFQPPENLDYDHRKFLRISSSISELSLLRELPLLYREGYAVAKILVSECPKIQLDECINVESLFSGANIESNIRKQTDLGRGSESSSQDEDSGNSELDNVSEIITKDEDSEIIIKDEDSEISLKDEDSVMHIQDEDSDNSSQNKDSEKCNQDEDSDNSSQNKDSEKCNQDEDLLMSGRPGEDEDSEMRFYDEDSEMHIQDSDSEKLNDDGYNGNVEITLIPDTESVLKGAMLVKDGQINDLSSWIVEIEQGVVHKLFTPKEAVAPNVSVVLGDKNSTLERKYELLSVQRGKATWYWFGPPKWRTDAADKTEGEVDRNMLVHEWVKQKLTSHLEEQISDIIMGKSDKGKKQSSEAKVDLEPASDIVIDEGEVGLKPCSDRLMHEAKMEQKPDSDIVRDETKVEQRQNSDMHIDETNLEWKPDSDRLIDEAKMEQKTDSDIVRDEAKVEQRQNSDMHIDEANVEWKPDSDRRKYEDMDEKTGQKKHTDDDKPLCDNRKLEYQDPRLDSTMEESQTTQAQEYRTEWEGGEILNVDDIISSYMLKNCLFEVAAEFSSTENIGCIDLVKLIFQKLSNNASAGKLKVYFLPFLDVFSFSKTHVHMVADEELKELIQKQCDRIQMFCKVILSILKQKPRQSNCQE